MKRMDLLVFRIVQIGTIASILIACSRRANADFVFGEPVNLGPTLNSAHDENGVCISPDGLSLYFTSNRPGGLGDYDLYVTTRETTHDDWAPPVNLGTPANTQYTCWRPSISNDGLSLYFSDGHAGLTGTPMPGGLGGDGDIWVLTRETTDDHWGPPVNVGAAVNSEHAIFPGISADGLSLYFSSHRSGTSGHCDLMVATRPTRSYAFGVPTFLKGGVNSSSNGEWGPDISADGLTLFFFHSLGLNILMARRSTTEEAFGIPVELPELVNTSYAEGWPSLSTDGSTLYFGSNRPGGSGGLDLWQAPILPLVDFNGDSIVDSADMCIMVDHWGEDYFLCDIGPMPWGDGIVDVQDLIVLAEHLFEEFPPVEPVE
ncbi:MAG: PD40 domain-containing protein [Phycisphaerales bacterium]|nr:MAG: PD40 domain-containing protein [Phycisphaerales bacterium]